MLYDTENQDSARDIQPPVNHTAGRWHKPVHVHTQTPSKQLPVPRPAGVTPRATGRDVKGREEQRKAAGWSTDLLTTESCFLAGYVLVNNVNILPSVLSYFLFMLYLFLNLIFLFFCSVVRERCTLFRRIVYCVQ